ncbi:hypothetical protein N183_00300 [Sinorhizobium sp. Sb3]|nr:hypothetical protein N183_00300 [Sinorhizobium sp. Sb3]
MKALLGVRPSSEAPLLDAHYIVDLLVHCNKIVQRTKTRALTFRGESRDEASASLDPRGSAGY